jgi:hypothetical protein
MGNWMWLFVKHAHYQISLFDSLLASSFAWSCRKTQLFIAFGF